MCGSSRNRAGQAVPEALASRKVVCRETCTEGSETANPGSNLKVHPDKTKIVYCKKEGRNLKGHPVQFDFLGFSFQTVRYQLRKGGSFLQYDCKMSRKSKVRISQDVNGNLICTVFGK
jgi:hypothetical protein